MRKNELAGWRFPLLLQQLQHPPGQSEATSPDLTLNGGFFWRIISTKMALTWHLEVISKLPCLLTSTVRPIIVSGVVAGGGRQAHRIQA